VCGLGSLISFPETRPYLSPTGALSSTLTQTRRITRYITIYDIADEPLGVSPSFCKIFAKIAGFSAAVMGSEQIAEPSLLHRSLNVRPTVVSSASGSYLTLSSGRQILDGCAGAAVAVIGHGNKEVQEAMMRQISQVSYITTLVHTTQAAEDLADVLVGDKPFGLTKAYLVCSGSEAMDSAMKLARQYHVENGQPQRKRFVSRRQAYHGNTIGAMSVSSYVSRKIPYKDAILLENVSFVSAAYAYRGMAADETEEEYAARLVDELDREFQRLGPETVIAFTAETVSGATAACITAPRGYFEGVRRVCDKYGILLILDEVMCGVGRTGSYFAFEQEGDVRPDLVTVGKGVGGGYAPIAGVLIHEKVVEGLRQGTGSFNHGHTYQAHAVSCAASLAVQRIIKRDNLVEQCARNGKVLEDLLKRTLTECKYVGNIRGRGLFWGVEFVRDKSTKQPFPAGMGVTTRVQEAAFDLGLAVYPGQGTADGREGDHVLVAPPLNITMEDIEKMVDLLKQAYDVVERDIDTQKT
jgi:adenosylmethionine-8-amino-7-oxononanoate aminotransferase